jgi:hypothetical protein
MSVLHPYLLRELAIESSEEAFILYLAHVLCFRNLPSNHPTDLLFHLDSFVDLHRRQRGWPKNHEFAAWSIRVTAG